MPRREFAIDVVRRLQRAGFVAYWAGGCVRDMIMDREPADYDVATSATPDQIRALFGRKRTLALGAAFGVITVLGGKRSGQIEVATFRRDCGYSDGRRPDRVEFSDDREDALRRDFTINGLFFDPIAERVIDYVDGRADIDCRIIRAIGDPDQRIAEDKLRMLRAVRFAATLNFELEGETAQAVRRHAAEIQVVSSERIGMEMRRMLGHERRSEAAELLRECGLVDHLLDEGPRMYRNRASWRTRLRWMARLGCSGEFVQAAAIWLSPLLKCQGIQPTAERWRLSNAEQRSILWIERNRIPLSRAHKLPWSQIQPLLIDPDAERTVQVIEVEFGAHHPGVRVCRERLAWPREQLDPAPLLNGADLIEMGVKPGPVFSKILDRLRAAQLDAEIETPDQARALARVLLAE